MYLLLGDSDCSLLSDKDNVVVARNLPYNREEYPLFVSYTGWYSIWQNNLIDNDTDYINLFEYDITLSINFDELFFNELRKLPDIIFFTLYSMKSPMFMKDEWIDKVEEYYKKYKNIDLKRFFDNFDKTNSYWSCSTNLCFNKQLFFEFMSDFEKLFPLVKESEYQGHQFEQSISFYMLLNNKKISQLKNILFHFQANSHKNTKFAKILNYETIKNDLLKNKI